MHKSPPFPKLVKSHYIPHFITSRFESGLSFLGTSLDLHKKTVRKRDLRLKQKQMQRATLFGVALEIPP
jgi:hypothetical protein